MGRYVTHSVPAAAILLLGEEREGLGVLCIRCMVLGF